MAKIKSNPKLQNLPALEGGVEVYPFRGKLCIRKKKAKKGPKKSAKQQRQVDWFSQARRLIKYSEPQQMRRAIEQTRNTLIYPADLLMMAMAGNYIDTIETPEQTYTKWEPQLMPVAYQGCVTGLDATETGGSFSNVTPDLGLPSIQTVGIWAPSEPTRLQVPANVGVVEVGFKYRLSLSSDAWGSLWITKNGADNIAYGAGRYFSLIQGICSTGPILVNEGDYFEFTGRFGAGYTWPKSDQNQFWMTILTATP